MTRCWRWQILKAKLCWLVDIPAGGYISEAVFGIEVWRLAYTCTILLCVHLSPNPLLSSPLTLFLAPTYYPSVLFTYTIWLRLLIPDFYPFLYELKRQRAQKTWP